MLQELPVPQVREPVQVQVRERAQEVPQEQVPAPQGLREPVQTELPSGARSLPDSSHRRQKLRELPVQVRGQQLWEWDPD